ncbi:GNAT family N-acetyltransferase [Ramlibacter tataouinensis]|uniref:Candidate PhnO protein n=1 Tax=Ramlibacter tataouinensis (strain ATCC BAA-407 / DSM 14655 / LMG 21543 / TTB310) TaxID=365046 RepID=F5XZY8_RAMTT|nr:GNAT family N-acetyltransferase [Ramlibacter tataouinensis]AEG93349.1 Candidate PhnO protein [Ramlibacter tataouinensis TTB310]
MTPAVRPAGPGDAPAVIALLAQLGYPGGEAFVPRRLAELAAHPDALLLLAEAGGEVLGLISLHFIPQLALPGDFCRISYLCVHERARSLGLGAVLEAHAVEQARRRGCDRIELHSHQRRVDAHRFYARQGYRESPKYLLKTL